MKLIFHFSSVLLIIQYTEHNIDSSTTMADPWNVPNPWFPPRLEQNRTGSMDNRDWSTAPNMDPPSLSTISSPGTRALEPPLGYRLVPITSSTLRAELLSPPHLGPSRRLELSSPPAAFCPTDLGGRWTGPRSRWDSGLDLMHQERPRGTDDFLRSNPRFLDPVYAYQLEQRMVTDTWLRVTTPAPAPHMSTRGTRTGNPGAGRSTEDVGVQTDTPRPNDRRPAGPRSGRGREKAFDTSTPKGRIGRRDSQEERRREGRRGSPVQRRPQGEKGRTLPRTHRHQPGTPVQELGQRRTVLRRHLHPGPRTTSGRERVDPVSKTKKRPAKRKMLGGPGTMDRCDRKGSKEKKLDVAEEKFENTEKNQVDSRPGTPPVRGTNTGVTQVTKTKDQCLPEVEQEKQPGPKALDVGPKTTDDDGMSAPLFDSPKTRPVSREELLEGDEDLDALLMADEELRKLEGVRENWEDPQVPEYRTIMEKRPQTAYKFEEWSLTVRRKNLIIGDSNIAALVPPMSRDLQVVAYPGMKTFHLRHLLREKTSLEESPRRVILSVGVNDRDCTTEQAARALERLREIRRLAQKVFPQAIVAFTQIPFPPRMENRQTEILRGMNEHIANLAPYIPLPAADQIQLAPDNVHWRPGFAKTMLDIFLTFLGLQA